MKGNQWGKYPPFSKLFPSTVYQFSKILAAVVSFRREEEGDGQETQMINVCFATWKSKCPVMASSMRLIGAKNLWTKLETQLIMRLPAPSNDLIAGEHQHTYNESPPSAIVKHMWIVTISSWAWGRNLTSLEFDDESMSLGWSTIYRYRTNMINRHSLRVCLITDLLLFFLT